MAKDLFRDPLRLQDFLAYPFNNFPRVQRIFRKDPRLREELFRHPESARYARKLYVVLLREQERLHELFHKDEEMELFHVKGATNIFELFRFLKDWVSHLGANQAGGLLFEVRLLEKNVVRSRGTPVQEPKVDIDWKDDDDDLKSDDELKKRPLPARLEPTAPFATEIEKGRKLEQEQEQEQEKNPARLSAHKQLTQDAPSQEPTAPFATPEEWAQIVGYQAEELPPTYTQEPTAPFATPEEWAQMSAPRDAGVAPPEYTPPAVELREPTAPIAPEKKKIDIPPKAESPKPTAPIASEKAADLSARRPDIFTEQRVPQEARAPVNDFSPRQLLGNPAGLEGIVFPEVPGRPMPESSRHRQHSSQRRRRELLRSGGGGGEFFLERPKPKQ